MRFLGESIYPRRAWVARITGCVGRHLLREFLRGQRDWAGANSVGSRGVRHYFWLEDGQWYEVSAPLSWKRDDRYFCVVRDPEIIRVSRDEVVGHFSNDAFRQYGGPCQNED
jgi:hypothetical protein